MCVCVCVCVCTSARVRACAPLGDLRSTAKESQNDAPFLLFSFASCFARFAAAAASLLACASAGCTSGHTCLVSVRCERACVEEHRCSCALMKNLGRVYLAHAHKWGVSVQQCSSPRRLGLIVVSSQMHLASPALAGSADPRVCGGDSHRMRGGVQHAQPPHPST